MKNLSVFVLSFLNFFYSYLFFCFPFLFTSVSIHINFVNIQPIRINFSAIASARTAFPRPRFWLSSIGFLRNTVVYYCPTRKVRNDSKVPFISLVTFTKCFYLRCVSQNVDIKEIKKGQRKIYRYEVYLTVLFAKLKQIPCSLYYNV